jgi:NAD(P)-dependent dehydrogenase (short-subunit alcohol dehydrogenase family)
VGQDLSGLVACITGSGSGMGRAHALLLAQHGARLLVQDIVAERAQHTTSQISAAGGSAQAIVCDVADRMTIVTALRGAERTFGGIDILEVPGMKQRRRGKIITFRRSGA